MHRTLSLSTRLTLWYSLFTFTMVLVTTGVLYWSLVRTLNLDDGLLLADRIQALNVLLAQEPESTAVIKARVENEWAARKFELIFARVLDEQGRTITQTPGFDVLGAGLFENTPVVESTTQVRSAMKSVESSDRELRMLTFRAHFNGTPPRVRVIQIALDRTHQETFLSAYRKKLFFVLGLSLLFCVLVGRAIARRELERLADSFERLSRFSADIAHELRTPLNNLRGEIEVAMGKRRSVEEYQDVLGSGLEECNRISRIIDSLLFLAKAENPSLQVTKEVVDIRRELLAVADFYEASASDAGIRLNVDAPEGLRVLAERTLLQRAIGNMVANAIHYTGPGGVIDLSVRVDSGVAHIEVRDTGVGIAPEHITKVFDRFYRVDSARSSKVGGHGLGLAIVKSIAQLHNGTVKLQSTPGKGTRVTLSLPAQA